MTDRNTPSATTVVKPAPAGNWKRRGIRILAVVGAAVILLRLSLLFLLPAVLQHALGYYGLKGNWQRLSLSVLGGDLSIWDLKVSPQAGGPPVIESEYCHGNVSVLRLFIGRLYLRRVEADGANIYITRDSSGNGPLLHALLAKPAAQSGTTVAGKWSLSAPLRIRAFRLEHMKLHLIDKSVRPAVDTRLDMNIRVSELGLKGKPTRFGLSFWSGTMLDTLRVGGTFTNTASTLSAHAHVFMIGLHLKPVAGYLRPLGLVPTAGSLSLHATAECQLHVLPTPHAALTASCGITDLLLSAQGQPALGIAKLALAAELKGKLLNISNVTLDGCHFYARRTRSGTFQFAGLNLSRALSAPPRARTPVAVKVAVKAVAANSVLKAAANVVAKSKQASGHYAFGIQAVHLHDLELTWLDHALVPTNRITLKLNSLVATNSGGLPGQPSFHLRLKGNGSVPGVASAFTLSGSSLPFAHPALLNARFAATGITAGALQPYLRAAGLASELTDGSLHLRVQANVGRSADGTLFAGFSLHNLVFADAGKTLLNFPGMELSALRVNPVTGRFEVGKVLVDGPDFSITREKSGDLSLLGVRLLGRSKPSARLAKAEAGPHGPAGTPVLPRIQVDSFLWHHIRIHFQDDAPGIARGFSIAHAGLSVKNFLLDMAHVSAHPRTGIIHAWVAAPGLLQSAELSGTLLPGKNRLGFVLSAVARQLNLTPLTPYLVPRGILPLMTNGTLSAGIKGRLEKTADSYRGEFQATNVRLLNGSRTLASLAALDMSGVRVSPHGLAIAKCGVIKPWIHIARTKQGRLEALGLRFVPASGGVVNSPVPAGAVPPPAGAARFFLLQKFSLKKAGLLWTDADVCRPVTLRISATATASHVLLGSATGRHWSHFAIQASIPGVLGNMSVRSRFAALTRGGNTRAALTVALRHISAAPLEPYIPRNMYSTMQNGSLQLAANLFMHSNPKGGMAGRFVLQSLDLSNAIHDPVRHGPAGMVVRHLLQISPAILTLARFDPAAHRIAINLATVTVHSLRIARRTNGDWSLLGLGLAAHPLRPAGPAPVITVPTGAFRFPTVPVLPLVTLQKLRLRADSIRIENFPTAGSVRQMPTTRNPSAGPALHLTNVLLANTQPLRCLGKAPALNPAIALRLTGRAAGLAHAFAIGVHLRPFANLPSLHTTLRIAGIKGSGISRFVPAFGDMFNPAALTDGQLAADASARIQMDRTSPISFNFSQPFSVDAKIRNVAFRRRAGGKIWAGVKLIQADKINISPTDHSVSVPLVNILTPQAFVSRQGKRITILGLSMAVPQAGPIRRKSSGPSAARLRVPQGHSAYAGRSRPMQSIPVSAGQPGAGPMHLTVGRVVVSGCTMAYADKLLHIHVPLTGLEMEVRNIGSDSPQHPVPMGFSLLVYSKPVAIGGNSTGPANPTGSGKGNQVTLAAPTAKVQATGARKPASATGPRAVVAAGNAAAIPPSIPAVPVRRRKLFAQVSANGQIYVNPKIHGWIQTSINGLELAAFAHAAANAGVTLGGGVFDGSTDTRIASPRKMDTHVKLVFTDLKLSEPATGPLHNVLRLPTPLDVAVAAIEAPDGSITLSFGVPIRNSHISMSAVEGGVIGSMAKAIAIGIASSPLKLVGGLFGGASAKPAPYPPLFVRYSPAATGLTAQGDAAIRRVIHLLQNHDSLQVVVRQQLSTADIAVARQRANPSVTQAMELIHALRRRQSRLLLQRVALVGRLQGNAAIRLRWAAIRRNRSQLLRLDQRLTHTRLAIDFLASVLEPGAQRESGRRTRGVAVLIGQRREALVKTLLLASGVNHIHRRVHIVFPQFKPVKSAAGGATILTLVRVSGGRN